MGSKIVSICMTVLMLAICLIMMFTLNIITKQTMSNVPNLTISTNSEIIGDKELVVSGSSLISSIVGIYQINDRAVKDANRIYNVNNLINTSVSLYNFRFVSGGGSGNADIIKAINPSLRYKLKYEDNVDEVSKVKTTTILIEEYTEG